MVLFVQSCISFDSYIKPQHGRYCCLAIQVVYLLIPTSNHNPRLPGVLPRLLYIFWFLHQTTTCDRQEHDEWRLYIFWFLHQTTTWWRCRFPSACCISFDSYIKPQPPLPAEMEAAGCISFDSYIKPQLMVAVPFETGVVYLLIPTSNHNMTLKILELRVLYIFWFLHQTTTPSIPCCSQTTLYIFWFLHQTTTPRSCWY